MFSNVEASRAELLIHCTVKQLGLKSLSHKEM
jgi:hypothetical protein